jgi:acyl-CoA reductase-like NAD-dependent aldehyde dehydrogenase
VAALPGAAFGHAGQSCISVQRLIVHEDVAEQVEKELGEQTLRLRVGDPLDEATDVSALIDRASRDRVREWIDEAVTQGARVVVGGDVVDGLLQPTVLADVTPQMRVCRAEVFGPVVGLATYRDLDVAIALANDTDYGLHAGIWTSSLSTALHAASALDFGGVVVNDVPTWRADQMPYGGVRDSGNTREGPASAVLEMTEVRTVVLRP